MNPSIETYTIAQWLFTKGLAICYFIAFLSLHVQVLGLYGSNGILPIKDFLHGALRLGKRGYFYFPSIFWWKSEDRFLRAVSLSGVIISLFVFFGIASSPLLLVLWFFYLSFVSVGQEFLSFQWDILLLEVGFLGFVFSLSQPFFLMIVLFWVLLFRFMFSSGLVKILSGCPEWRSLKAMSVHYETQPLPNQIAYYMHQQAPWFSKFSCLVVLMIEIIVPFFIFGSSWSREMAFCLLVSFQILILLTGNYAFFNLLTIVMCLPLLPDAVYEQWFAIVPSIPASAPSLFTEITITIFAIFFIFLNTLQIAALFAPLDRMGRILHYLSPFFLVNAYGLFAWMTTKRYEIIIEGSDDNENWLAYEFKWKPGDIYRAPRQVAPHQPRLDWQIWFAALSDYRSNPWFTHFIMSLSKGSPEVLRLLKSNPFPNKPPSFIRARLFQYHFSDLKTKKEAGQWWVREELGSYLPGLVENNQI